SSRSIVRRRRDVLRAMGAGWIDRVRWLHVHELAPPLATALRHALGTGMVVGVVTEMVVGAEHGLGARALSAQIAYDAPGLYAVIALTGGIALALSSALSAIEGWARRRTIDLDESAAAQHAPRYLPMRRHSRWALAVILVGAGGAIAVGTAARSTFLLPEPVPQTATPRVVDRVRELFPQTAGWFRIVSGARFEPGEGGRLVPVLASLTHPRVRWQDGAGHAVVSQFAPHFRTATRIGSTEHAGVWLDLTPVEGRDVQAQIQDGLVVYPDAYASTDVLYKSTPTHVDEYLLLRDSQAPLRWAYRVRLGPGLARIRQAGNQIEAVDARGIPWLRAGMPRAVDREGRKVDGTIRIEGSRVEVALDVSGLSYPILVDPDWRSTGDMAYGRFYHRADVPDDGRVLVTGGCSASVCSGDLTRPACRAVVPAIEAFDLASRTFARVVDSPVPRFFHVTQELTDGSILIAGGCTN
ncbi:MAG: hypothetical protein K8H88_23280, partial [Sandaracinaceae bacterium]|nr:hypothetical protein [Sandaracinaceae bacterium]